MNIYNKKQLKNDKPRTMNKIESVRSITVYPEDINCYYAFLHGAEWADEHPKNVWHDASEMPERFSCEILYEIRSGNGFEVTYLPEGLTADNWFNILKVCGIVRWAYISELLPKGGEK